MTSALGATGCSFWSAKLSFTAPITARHYCLLGNNRFVAPTTFGVCNDYDPTNGSVCNECLTLDGQEKRSCHFVKGYGPELGLAPPAPGYDDTNCPMGYDQFTNVDVLDLACPDNSVLVLEIFPQPLNTTSTASSTTTALLNPYDFRIQTPHNVIREFESHQCLTGTGGRGCGEDALTMLAYQTEGICGIKFHPGQGYKVHCNNGLTSNKEEEGEYACFAKNGLSCMEVMQQSATTNIVVLSNENEDGDFPNGLCGLDESQGLANPTAWLVGALTVLLTLAPGFSYWRKGDISPSFLLGLLSEAMKNGLVMASIISVNWSCLQKFGVVIPTESHAIFLPYSLVAFSLGDNILALIALASRWGQDLDDTFDRFKWLGDDLNPTRRILTFFTIVIFGGFGGFMQLGLVLEGIVDNPEESGNSALNNWASWIFIISASLGGFFGTILILIGVYTGKMRVAWKTFKILVGGIPGLVGALDLAVVLSVGWLAEAFADVVHIFLYVHPLLITKKASSLPGQRPRD